MKQRVRDWIDASDRTIITAKHVGKDIDVSNTKIGTALTELVEQGEIEMYKRGNPNKYKI